MAGRGGQQGARCPVPKPLDFRNFLTCANAMLMCAVTIMTHVTYRDVHHWVVGRAGGSRRLPVLLRGFCGSPILVLHGWQAATR